MLTPEPIKAPYFGEDKNRIKDSFASSIQTALIIIIMTVILRTNLTISFIEVIEKFTVQSVTTT